MKVIGREDVDLGGGGSFTYKLMENGEERRHVVFPAGSRVSETVASDWSPAGGDFPWQDTHYHRGLTEHYFVQHSWVGFLFEKNGKLEWQKVEAGGHICFPPPVPHAVLMGPGAVMATMLVGSAVGNPDRKGDDWWPAPDYSGYSWELEKLRLEETVG